MRQSESEAPVVPKWAIQGAQTHDRDWSWVQATVWTERMLAALENGVKGNKWFSLIDKVYRPATLAAAQSVQHYAARAERYLGELGQALKSGTYQPLAVRRVDIPKGPGKTRPLGIPAVKDRVVQTALKWVLEPIFEREFCETSYGFRPGRGCKDALREVDRLVKAGYTHVVDADLAGYFDSIPHANLMERVAERGSDARILDLIAAYLHQEVMRGMERWTPTGGTPQGAVISPLLANLYLHPLDCLLRERGFQMVRYCDDFVVLCQSADQAQAALAEVRTWVSANGLSLNADKTQVGDCRCEGEGFEFLGYRFEAGRREVRRKSLAGLRERIRGKTGRTQGKSLRVIIAQLNPVLRGWYNYFKHANPPLIYQTIDGFTRRRLRAILCAWHKRPQLGHSLWAQQRWPNRYFAEQGLFTLVQAHALASQSR